MTTLIHSQPEGPAGQQIDLLTPATRTRSRVLELDSNIVDNESLVPGTTVTDALNSLSGRIPTGNLQSQIGYIPGAGGLSSNVLTLRSAGHTPGMYLVGVAMICRAFTAGAPLFTPVVSYNAPGTGAATQNISQLNQPSALGPLQTQVTVTTVLIRPPSVLLIESDGSAAITVQVTSAANVNTFDLYAGAALIAS